MDPRSFPWFASSKVGSSQKDLRLWFTYTRTRWCGNQGGKCWNYQDRGIDMQWIASRLFSTCIKYQCLPWPDLLYRFLHCTFKMISKYKQLNKLSWVSWPTSGCCFAPSYVPWPPSPPSAGLSTRRPSSTRRRSSSPTTWRRTWDWGSTLHFLIDSLTLSK